ncbi:hypothetical protein SDC9_174885 [bioreactor metagenome]|uniref:Uncharacterized protein n=1 Tax=bioreactor metagenome TaxID=1076179 RepID=A0A645GNI4_9ZZZZ
MLDAAPQQAAALAFDQFAVQRQRPEKHAGRTLHGRPDIGKREAPLVTAHRIGGDGNDLRIDHRQRHPGQKRFLARTRNIAHRLQRQVEHHHPHRFSYLRRGKADAVKRSHNLNHPGGKLTQFGRHRSNRIGDPAQNRISHRMNHISFLISEQHLSSLNKKQILLFRRRKNRR